MLSNCHDFGGDNTLQNRSCDASCGYGLNTRQRLAQMSGTTIEGADAILASVAIRHQSHRQNPRPLFLFAKNTLAEGMPAKRALKQKKGSSQTTPIHPVRWRDVPCGPQKFKGLVITSWRPNHVRGSMTWAWYSGRLDKRPHQDCKLGRSGRSKSILCQR